MRIAIRARAAAAAAAKVPGPTVYEQAAEAGRAAGAVAGAAAPLAPDEWTHLALTHDGEQGRFFVNGARPGEARGTLQLRNHEAVVKILFSKQNLQIDYVSSENLLHSGNEIHQKSNNWGKNL